MEEYDWGAFAVITSLLPGYDTFVDIVEAYTDTSYFLWNLQDVLTLEMSVGSNDGKTKRMLQQVRRTTRRLGLVPPTACENHHFTEFECKSLEFLTNNGIASNHKDVAVLMLRL